jgi:hypothetical protein
MTCRVYFLKFKSVPLRYGFGINLKADSANISSRTVISGTHLLQHHPNCYQYGPDHPASIVVKGLLLKRDLRRRKAFQYSVLIITTASKYFKSCHSRNPESVRESGILLKERFRTSLPAKLKAGLPASGGAEGDQGRNDKLRYVSSVQLPE